MSKDGKFVHDDPRFDHIDRWYYPVYAEYVCHAARPIDLLALFLSARYLGFH